MVVRGFGLCLVGCVRLPFPFWGRGHLLCGCFSCVVRFLWVGLLPVSV